MLWMVISLPFRSFSTSSHSRMSSRGTAWRFWISDVTPGAHTS